MLSWGVLKLGLNWVLAPCACLKTLCPSLDITPRNGLHLRCCSKLLYHVCKLLECSVMFGPKLGCCSKLLYHSCKLLEPAVMFGPNLGCCWWLLWGNGMDGWALAGKCLIKQALANTGMSSWLPIYQGGGRGARDKLKEKKFGRGKGGSKSRSNCVDLCLNIYHVLSDCSCRWGSGGENILKEPSNFTKPIWKLKDVPT